jgi:hypothetical protein
MLFKTNLTKSEALQSYGGYSIIENSLYVCDFENRETEHDNINSCFIVGIEYDKNGANLNLNDKMVKQILDDVFKNAPYSFKNIEGAWEGDDFSPIEENSILIDAYFDDLSIDWGVYGERLRLAFRQKAVIAVLPDYFSYLIEE